MLVGREIGTPANAALRIDVNRGLARPAGLAHFPPKVPGNVGDVPVRAGNHTSMPALERQQIAHERLHLLSLPGTKQVVRVAILEVRVHRKVHARSDRSGVRHNGAHVVEIVVLDHGIEAHRHPFGDHLRDHRKDLCREAGDAACDVMPRVEIVERDADLGESRFPQRSRALDAKHATMRQQREVGERHGACDFGDDRLKIPTQQRFAAGERDHHGREPARGMSERPEFALAFLRIGFPVVAECTAGIAAHRHFEVHEHGASLQPQARVANRERDQVIRLEPCAQHGKCRANADLTPECAGRAAAGCRCGARCRSRCRSPRPHGAPRRCRDHW